VSICLGLATNSSKQNVSQRFLTIHRGQQTVQPRSTCCGRLAPLTLESLSPWLSNAWRDSSRTGITPSIVWFLCSPQTASKCRRGVGATHDDCSGRQCVVKTCCFREAGDLAGSPSPTFPIGWATGTARSSARRRRLFRSKGCRMIRPTAKTTEPRRYGEYAGDWPPPGAPVSRP